nr:MAG TPA: hypothetical protein [Caudoviricetes sp.]
MAGTIPAPAPMGTTIPEAAHGWRTMASGSGTTPPMKPRRKPGVSHGAGSLSIGHCWRATFTGCCISTSGTASSTGGAGGGSKPASLTSLAWTPSWPASSGCLSPPLTPYCSNFF